MGRREGGREGGREDYAFSVCYTARDPFLEAPWGCLACIHTHVPWSHMTASILPYQAGREGRREGGMY